LGSNRHNRKPAGRAIGVIATLMYLSIQIRQRNNQLRGTPSSVHLKSET
jgi:hypothetical protein